MTRQEAIELWKSMAAAVFMAEEAISKEWNERLHAAPSMTHEEKQQFIDEYMTAIATEIVSKTSDEELAEMEHPEIHSYNTDNESNRTDDW